MVSFELSVFSSWVRSVLGHLVLWLITHLKQRVRSSHVGWALNLWDLMLSSLARWCEHWVELQDTQLVLENCLFLWWKPVTHSHIGNQCSCCWVAKLCPSLCKLMDCNTWGSSIPHCLPECAQIHIHWVGDAV